MADLIIFAGVPGSGKTSVIKNVIKYFNSVGYVKVDVFFSEDEKQLDIEHKKTELAKDICPDHYTAMLMEDFLNWADINKTEHLIVETAGLCFRCSPYTKNSVAVAVVDAIGTDIRKLGPIIKYCDIVAVTKYDIISQSERDIIKHKIKMVNDSVDIIEVNGITGEGSYELYKEIVQLIPEKRKEPFELRFVPPSAICEFCYGMVGLEKQKRREFITNVLKIAKKIPKLNCGACGYKTCNDFLRKVVKGEEDPKRCIFYKED